MFVAQEKGPSRKPFQKPNILRRKAKVTNRNTERSNESSLLSSISSDFGLISLPVVQAQGLPSQPLQISQAPNIRVFSIDEVCNDAGNLSQTLDINGDSLTIYAHEAETEDTNISTTPSTFNVESFLNETSIKKEKKVVNPDYTSEIVETDTKQKWCLDFESEGTKDVLASNYYDGSQKSNFYADETLIVYTPAEIKPLVESSLSETNVSLTEPAQIDLDENTTVKFMCDVPNCKKSFWTEARLQKHKNVHNKPKTFPVLHCPVKSTDTEGVETQCDRTFQIRSQLMKHLNDEHSPEDALYKCAKCGRRFYWACGARLHQANGCARSFTCAWAGCGRVFRQQCRLREHARAHTGDRPYHCHYPDCEWSFRSASKLMRHARRHTGERRHACAVCGRCFPRRDHLREHVARHQAAAATNTPAHNLTCTHTGCEQTFTSPSSLNVHMKKVHKNGDNLQPPKKQRRAKKNMFVVQLTPPPPTIEASVEALPVTEEGELEHVQAPLEIESLECASLAPIACSGVEAGDADGRCARTHCTWPLRPREAHYNLEHAQVEQSESCESNIYTVRSDLFLHGNLLINEDSEFVIRGAAVGAEGADAAAEGALGLLDAHPTGGLTQEELYADAVDESSFRVFLLNGEELA